MLVGQQIHEVERLEVQDLLVCVAELSGRTDRVELGVLTELTLNLGEFMLIVFLQQWIYGWLTVDGSSDELSPVCESRSTNLGEDRLDQLILGLVVELTAMVTRPS